MCEGFIAQLSPADQERVFGGTAASFYGLDGSGRAG